MAELAAKIDALIVAIGGPSYDKIAQEIKADGGPTVSGAYLWQLRTGARDNPTFHHLQALSTYFSRKIGIPITLNYFDPETPVDQPWRDAQDEERVASLQRQLDEERELNTRLADNGVRRLATRYGEMGPALQRQILAIVETLSEQEAAEGKKPRGERDEAG
ncbi:hypothetical protein [Pseudonocardia acidicola]|uniref:XRE family transcriptional regulator n=1 Tax=Pseudonocardia acidicola TaxID=2724939 RepID=A0ABX1SKG0_9PSEU|nr:hypothetical protein [Pseudonocardia acidicola]NMI00634.1 hypothetical protein [Pseudonocardia acidicola]